MILRLYASASILLGALGLTAFAQPGCSAIEYRQADYCSLAAQHETVVIGQIAALRQLRNESAPSRLVAQLKYFRKVYGDAEPTPAIVIPEGPNPGNSCTRDVDVGGTYLFALSSYYKDDNGVWSLSRLRLDTLPEKEQARIINGIKEITAGKRQEALYGNVRRPDGSPFKSVEVIAKANGKSFLATTNADGRYGFGALPDGGYTVFVNYPYGYGPNNSYDRQPRESDEREVRIKRVESWPCGTSQDFSTALSARLSVTYRAGPSDWHPFFRLADASQGMSEGHNLVGIGHYDDILSFKGEKGKDGLTFYHLRQGRYVLKLGLGTGWNPLATYYYPGVRSIENAEIFEVGLGTVLNLDFSLEPFSLVTIRGQMKLSDGSPINAGAIFIDPKEPSAYLVFSPADRERTDFVFETIKDRLVDVCAGYDGVLKNGTQLRVYGRTRVNANQNLEDIVVTLNRKIPNRVRWWDECLKDP